MAGGDPPDAPRPQQPEGPSLGGVLVAFDDLCGGRSMDCAGKASAVAAPLDSVRVAARGLRPAAVEDAAVAIVVVVEIRWAAHSRAENAAVTGSAPRLVGRVEISGSSPPSERISKLNISHPIEMIISVPRSVEIIQSTYIFYLLVTEEPTQPVLASKCCPP